jgi:exopolysaccharide production protein ExoQ
MRDAGRRASVVATAIIAFLGFIAAYVSVQLSGTKTGAVLAIGATLGPALLTVAITAPIVFPFSLYAFLTPFDAILLVTSAATLTRLVGLASAAALLFYMIRTKRFTDPDRSVAIWTLYYFWIIASAFWAIDTKGTMDMLPTALALFGLYVVVAMFRIDLRGLQTFIAAVTAGGVCASAYLIYLYHNGSANFAGRMYLRTDDVNWNPDHLAAAMLLPLAFALMGAVSSRALSIRLLSILSIAIIIPTIALTGARGPELSTLAMMVYLFVRGENRKQFLALFAFLLVVGGAWFGPKLLTRWSEAFTTGGAGRTDIWHVGWIAFKENWLFGAGFNNFPAAYNHAFLQVFQPLYAGWSRAPHNILLGNGVELGCIGLVLLLLGWYAQFRMLRHIGPGDPRYRIRLCAEAALVGLFISGMFADVMLTKYVWLAFMVVVLTRNAAPVRLSTPAPRVAAHA